MSWMFDRRYVFVLIRVISWIVCYIERAIHESHEPTRTKLSVNDSRSKINIVLVSEQGLVNGTCG